MGCFKIQNQVNICVIFIISYKLTPISLSEWLYALYICGWKHQPKQKCMTKLSALLFVCLLFAGFSAQAQKQVGGEISVGGRFGGSSGVTLKKHNGYNTSAIEFIAQFKNFDKIEELDGFSLSALYQKLAPMSGSKQVSAIFGVGASMNFKDQFDMGVSGMIGFDWRLKAAPVTLQVDWMPTWFLIGENEFIFTNAAVSARYVLNGRKYKK